jgi:hypothetical protein
MLSMSIAARKARPYPSQGGIVLIVVLVVLVAMTLAAIALTRSMFTASRVAGNLAFQQSATQAADIGIEQAIAWLEQNNGALLTNVATSPSSVGYMATYQDPGTQSWEQFWDAASASGGAYAPYINTLPRDATSGNQVSYIIERLCKNTGPSTAAGAGCAVSPTVNGSGSSKGSGVIPFSVATQLYYRITVRVDGPRHAVGFVQAIIAL